MFPPSRYLSPRSLGMRVGAVLTTVLVSAGLFALAGSAQAQTAPTLGTAGSFAVLGSSGVTNTGPTVVSGDLGTSPNPAITGFPPGTVVNGTIHANDAVAVQARSDATTAYSTLAGQPCDVNLSGQDLGGLTLTSGVYCFDSSAQLTGTLTLDAQGDPNAVFIFQIGSDPHHGIEQQRRTDQWRGRVQRLLADRQLCDPRNWHQLRRDRHR